MRQYEEAWGAVCSYDTEGCKVLYYRILLEPVNDMQNNFRSHFKLQGP